MHGTLPSGWRTASGGTDWLTVADYLRTQYGMHGQISGLRDEGDEGSISFEGPGYSADCFFDRRTGMFRMSIAGDGPVGVLSDLHRGHQAGSASAARSYCY